MHVCARACVCACACAYICVCVRVGGICECVCACMCVTTRRLVGAHLQYNTKSHQWPSPCLYLQLHAICMCLRSRRFSSVHNKRGGEVFNNTVCEPPCPFDLFWSRLHEYAASLNWCSVQRCFWVAWFHLFIFCFRAVLRS